MNKLIFFLALMPSLLFGEPTPTQPLDFGGGLDVRTVPTLVADNASVDLCNCAPTLDGAMSKRNGSERLVNQAISSMGVTSLFQAYSSTSNGIIHKGLFGTSGDKIFYSSNSINPSWVVISSNNGIGQHYEFLMMNGKVLMAGDGLTENVKHYDLAQSSQYATRNAFATDTSTGGIFPRGKHHIVANNYYILANVQISTDAKHLTFNTTYYPNRLLYSLLNNFSSMTASRFIDYNPNDGEEITGLGSLYGADFKTVVNVFKPSSISELSFTVLNLPSQGGDWTSIEVVKGFGVIAPRTLVNTGQFYVFLAKDGIRVWDGGRQSRLTATDSSRIISGKIKPMIDELIRSGNYKNAVGIYYPQKEWYILSFESPTRFPKGKNNYVLVYDFSKGEWWPFCNWLADSFAVADNAGDNGTLYFGQSNDGFVNKADVETRIDDHRQEMSIDVMDSSYTWVGSTQDVVNVVEGTASIKMSIIAPNIGTDTFISSMTRMGIFQFGEWADKKRVSLSDRISFKAFTHNITSITSLRVDLEVKQIAGNFDSNFTSVTLSSSMFVGSGQWTGFEIPLSSFPIRPDWTDLMIESVPLANRFNAYGIRFVMNGVKISSISIDDLRLVGGSDNPNEMYRYTKMFDFNTPAFKSFGSMLLTGDKSPDAEFSMDIYNDFGSKLRTENFTADVPNEIAIFHTNNTPGITLLNSSDFSVSRETKTVSTHWDCLNGEMDASKIVCGDRVNDRLIAFNRTDFSTFTVVYGSFGAGAGNFNIIHEVRQVPGTNLGEINYLVSDLYNHRIKTHSGKNLGFVRMFGSLGSGTTNFHMPTGVCGDGVNVYVSDEANGRLVKFGTNGTFILQTLIDHNAIADSSLACDDKFIYMTYNKISVEANDTAEVVMDKRDKGNLSLVTRATVKPIGVSTGSYLNQGSIGILGRYVYVPFSSDDGQTVNPVFYLQKRLKSTLEIVGQYATDQRFFSVAGYGQSYVPLTSTIPKPLKTEGRYIQFKFYDDDSVENYWRLYNQTPLANIQPLTY